MGSNGKAKGIAASENTTNTIISVHLSLVWFVAPTYRVARAPNPKIPSV